MTQSRSRSHLRGDNKPTFVGSLREYREATDDDRLPWKYIRAGHIAALVANADIHGLYVNVLGAERYQVADMRGHILLKSATFAEAIEFVKGHSHAVA